ncbi:hypothetical protein PHISP_08336, partial [Aspergillus sp. HF37]
MPGASFEVPIVLSSENLAYEDIAKLNPFYEKYNNFWSARSEPESTLSSGASSKITLSGSFYSEPGSFYSAERSSSPVMDSFNNFDGVYVPDRLHTAIRSVNKCKPLYQPCRSLADSQFAFFENDSDCSPRYSHVHSPTELTGPDPHDLGLDSPCQQTLPRKKLFGENGWLGDTVEPKELTDKRKSKIFKGLGKKIKQHVGEIAEDTMVRVHSNPFNHYGSDGPKIVAKSPVPISLDSLTQAKLYSDMEFMICSSANNFLVGQYNAGHVSRESIKKTSDFWVSKNRPQVVEFQFDQATQRQLILSNVRTLDFHGESATNPILLHSNLQNWKAIVKEMSVRTFCLPDSAIRKHLYDIHKILDMLGAPLSTFLAFQELQMRTL